MQIELMSLSGTEMVFRFLVAIDLIIALVSAAVTGGYLLRAAGHPRLANVVHAMLALPGAVYGLFLGVVVLSGTPWNES